MKTTLSLSAAALVATALSLPMQAQAADRQISVNQKKFPTFTVDDSSQQDTSNTNTDTAEATPPKVKIQEFRVNDDDVKPTPARADDQADAQEETAPTPKKKKALRFKVQDQAEQALSTPAEDEADDVADAPVEKPANLLNEKVKLVKKPRVESNDEQEDAAAPAEDTSEDIAADTTDTEEANDPNELRYYVLKKKHHVQYQTEESYQPTTYNYQEPSYTGYSCHNSNNGY